MPEHLQMEVHSNASSVGAAICIFLVNEYVSYIRLQWQWFSPMTEIVIVFSHHK